MNAIFKTPSQWGWARIAVLTGLVVWAVLALSIACCLFLISLAPADSSILDYAIRNRGWLVHLFLPFFYAGLILGYFAISDSDLRRAAEDEGFGGLPAYGVAMMVNLSSNMLGLATYSTGITPKKPRCGWRCRLLLLIFLICIPSVLYARYRLEDLPTMAYLAVEKNSSCLGHVDQNDNKKKLLLFIHGVFGSPEGTWGNFPKLASMDRRFDGFDICAIYYPTFILRRNPTIKEYATFILQQLEDDEWHVRGRYDEIDVISHSMGGLISRQVEIDGLQDRHRLEFDKVVEIGTPHDGSAWASISKFHLLEQWALYPQIDAMQMDSNYLNSLQASWDHLRKKPDDYCIGSVQDSIVSLESADYDCIKENTRLLLTGEHIYLVSPASAADDRYLIPTQVLVGSREGKGDASLY
jgi:pimeloyl-ACP methyl ester carboxylesterase